MQPKWSYPWQDVHGISIAIAAPSLWARVFGEVEEFPVRHAIKRASKRVVRKFGVLRIDDDAAFGFVLARLLSSPRGRKELEEHHIDSFALSSELLNAIGIKHSDVLPSLNEVAPKNGDGWRELAHDKMQSWLVMNPLDERSRPAIAAMLCAFAMRRQTGVWVLAEDLAAADPEFGALLCAEQTPSEEVDSDTRLGPGEDDHSPEVAEKSLESDPVLDLSDRPGESWYETLSLLEWRRAIEQLRQQLSVGDLRLAEVEQLAESVTVEVRMAAALPWLREPLKLEGLAGLRENSSGATETARLQRVQTDLARLLRAHTQAETLTLRLGRNPGRTISGGAMELGEVSARLEALATELAAEAAAIAHSLDRARSFLDRLAAGDAATAVDMCEQAAPETWPALARTLFDSALNTAEIQPLRATLATEQVAGVLLALLVRSNADAGADLVRWVFLSPEQVRSRDRAEALFGFLSFAQLRKVGSTAPAAAEAAALLIFAAALRQNRAELFEHLTSFLDCGLDVITREFYRVLIEHWRRGRLVAPAAELRQAWAAGDESQAAGAAAEHQRRRLLGWLDSPPGMKKTFHLLRVYAQVQFLHPLRDLIEKGYADAAQRQWKTYGVVAEMVENCIAHLKSKDRPEARHYEQTAAYLLDFASDLDRWAALSASHNSVASPLLVQAIESLRLEAPRHSAAAAVLPALEAGENVDFPSLDFGERFDGDDRLRTPRMEVASWLTPTMLATWPLALEGEARLAHLVADTLRGGLAEEKISAAQAVSIYLSTNQLEAARSAAVFDPELTSRVDEVFKERRRALRDAHADLLAAAENAAEVDELAAECLGTARSALEEDDFAEAEAAFDLLADCVSQFQKRHDPARGALVDWLREADIEPDSALELKDLEAQVARLRESETGRRRHLQEMTGAAKHEHAAEPVQALWSEAARQFDRPRMWPDEETAELWGSRWQLSERPCAANGGFVPTMRIRARAWSGELRSGCPNGSRSVCPLGNRKRSRTLRSWRTCSTRGVAMPLCFDS